MIVTGKVLKLEKCDKISSVEIIGKTEEGWRDNTDFFMQIDGNTLIHAACVIELHGEHFALLYPEAYDIIFTDPKFSELKELVECRYNILEEYDEYRESKDENYRVHRQFKNKQNKS